MGIEPAQSLKRQVITPIPIFPRRRGEEVNKKPQRGRAATKTEDKSNLTAKNS
jgi:hypothetical protein